jgi:hypothetical protein
VEEKLLNRIIAVAYKDATFREKFKIYKLAKKDSEVKSTLDEYRKVANKTHNVDLENCPDEIVENVKKITRIKPRKDNSLLLDLYSFVFRRPAVSTAIFSVFIIALVSTFIIKRPEIHQQYSKQEIELADQQIKHSLALIAGVFKKTTLTIEDDVLTNRVSKPIKKSFNLVNDYLKGENNNENIN